MNKPVILGAGLAGLSAALALAPMPVIVVSPRVLGEGCSSAWAQGGVAAAMDSEDSAVLHAADTVAAGAGLNDAAIVRQTTEDARGIIEGLIALGVGFDRDTKGNLRLGLEAAHQRRRILHARDATGREIMRAMIVAVRATPSITVIEDAVAQELIIAEGRIAGVVIKREGKTVALETSQIVLATGGAAALWRNTTNPHENWGSGVALAARAGATLGDLEFVQFHPTAIDIGRDPMPLASEALRGEGALLIDDKDERFIDELQPRDIVARAIWDKISHGGRVFLDARHLQGFAARFPTIYAVCAGAGIDPAVTPIPVRTAAHYHMGGVVTDARGRTDVAGLWACGEVACTGLNGANRLASNSLLEAASFGARVAGNILNAAGQTNTIPSPASQKLGTLSRNAGEEIQRQVRSVMSDHVGVVRDRAGLKTAVAALLPLAEKSDMGLTAVMIAMSALRRIESRGAHFRSDFPQTTADARRSFFHISELEKL